jgi:hypothetical protein
VDDRRTKNRRLKRTSTKVERESGSRFTFTFRKEEKMAASSSTATPSVLPVASSTAVSPDKVTIAGERASSPASAPAVVVDENKASLALLYAAQMCWQGPIIRGLDHTKERERKRKWRKLPRAFVVETDNDPSSRRRGAALCKRLREDHSGSVFVDTDRVTWDATTALLGVDASARVQVSAKDLGSTVWDVIQSLKRAADRIANITEVQAQSYQFHNLLMNGERTILGDVWEQWRNRLVLLGIGRLVVLVGWLVCLVWSMYPFAGEKGLVWFICKCFGGMMLIPLITGDAVPGVGWAVGSGALAADVAWGICICKDCDVGTTVPWMLLAAVAGTWVSRFLDLDARPEVAPGAYAPLFPYVGPSSSNLVVKWDATPDSPMPMVEFVRRVRQWTLDLDLGYSMGPSIKNQLKWLIQDEPDRVLIVLVHASMSRFWKERLGLKSSRAFVVSCTASSKTESGKEAETSQKWTDAEKEPADVVVPADGAEGDGVVRAHVAILAKLRTAMVEKPAEVGAPVTKATVAGPGPGPGSGSSAAPPGASTPGDKTGKHCTRCDRSSHSATECFARTDRVGRPL